jgi:ribose transport system ATP-binding protein
MSHRILVMCEGRITAELPGGASQEQIMTYATRRTDVAAASAVAGQPAKPARTEHGPAHGPG